MREGEEERQRDTINCPLCVRDASADEWNGEEEEEEERRRKRRRRKRRRRKKEEQQ